MIKDRLTGKKKHFIYTCNTHRGELSGELKGGLKYGAYILSEQRVINL